MLSDATISQALLDYVLTVLAPLFMKASNSDAASARVAARSMLANYDAKNDEELRLAALNIGFGFSALDALGQALDPSLSVNQRTKMRSQAVALNRAAHMNRAALEKQRKGPAPQKAKVPETVTPQAMMTYAHAAMQTTPISRQQRREAERRAEKLKRQQEFQARKAARQEARAT